MPQESAETGFPGCFLQSTQRSPFPGRVHFLLSRLISEISLLGGGPGDVVFPRLLVLLVHWVNARTTLALVLPHTARLMDYIAAWWVACQLRPAQLTGPRHTFI